MSIRLRCASCRTAFVTSDDQAGRAIDCPKCGTKQKVPATVVVEEAPAPATLSGPTRAASSESVFVPTEPAPRRRRGWKIVLGVLGLLLVTGVGVLVALPRIKAWLDPTPSDRAEAAAYRFLKAIVDGDAEALKKLSTVDEPPAIRSFGTPKRDTARNVRIQGSFAPLADFNAQVDKKYVYDPETGRFTPRNAMGAAAELLDVLEDPKTKAEHDDIAKKIASGSPDELFDAAEGLAKSMIKLKEGALAPRKLLPTYRQLVEDAKPPLADTERAVAFDYADHRDTWNALLKRPFLTLKSDGPYRLLRTQVDVTAHDKLASSGDPPTKLRLELMRFQLDGIDTEWIVVSARRDLPKAPASELTVLPSTTQPAKDGAISRH